MIDSDNKLKNINAIVFDLDNVLFDKGSWVMLSMEYAAEQMGLDSQRAWELAVEFQETNGSVKADIYNHVLLGLGQSDSALNIRAFCALANQFQPARGQVRLYPGVQEALVKLSAKYQLGLITDGPVACQRSKVAALGIKQCFCEIIYSDIIAGIKSRKPDPRPFESMRLCMGVRKSNVLMIGCNPFKDFKQRRQEGYVTMRVLTGEYADSRYPSEAHEADFTCSSISQLADILERNNSKSQSLTLIEGSYQSA